MIQTSFVLLSIMEGLDSAVIVSLRFFLHGVEAAEVVWQKCTSCHYNSENRSDRCCVETRECVTIYYTLDEVYGSSESFSMLSRPHTWRKGIPVCLALKHAYVSMGAKSLLEP